MADGGAASLVLRLPGWWGRRVRLRQWESAGLLSEAGGGGGRLGGQRLLGPPDRGADHIGDRLLRAVAALGALTPGHVRVSLPPSGAVGVHRAGGGACRSVAERWLAAAGRGRLRDRR